MMLLLCIMTRLSADEVALTISKKLSNSPGPATTTVGDVKFEFTGDGTSYQNAYVKMVNGSALTVSTKNGNISKIVIDYASGRDKTNSFTANPGTWDDKTSTWTGSSNSVTLTAGEKGECSVSSVTVTYSSSSSLTFASPQQTASMTDLDVMALKPNNTTNNVTYTSSNIKIAQVDKNGWIRFVNTGMTTITATDTITNKSGSYTLLVTAQEATTSVSGKTYTLTSDGKISNKHILDVPYMNMQVGKDGEMTMAKSYGTNNYLGMTCLDRNGFVHVSVDKNGLPTMGTYYIFKPSAKGKLTVKGVFYQNGSGTADAHIYEGTTQKGTISYKAKYGVATGTFDLDAGKTYYLYVPTDDKAKNYDIFCLNSFTFASQYYFANKSVRVENGAKNYTQAVKGGDGSNYTVKAYGSLTSAIVDKSGKVSWSGDGGALVVTASLNGSSDSYVITVPYSEHEWDFRNPNVKLEDLNANTTDWAVTYKVRQFDQTSKALTYLNVPVMANGTAIDGNNALYVPATAGLLFKSDANGFGSKISWPKDLDFDGLTLDEQYALTYDKVSSVQLVTMYKGGVLTIPNLKKGQYIRIKWCRYTVNHGDHIQASNVTDLNGKEITGKFNVGVPSRHNKENGDYGYEFFIVKEDGDVTFKQMDEGWTDIYDIKVADEKGIMTDGNLQTDLRLIENNKTDYAKTIVYSGSTTVTYSQETGILHVMSCMADGDGGTKGTVKYTFVRKEGNVEANMTENGVLTITGGQGILTIKQEGINQDYTLDRNVTDVTVYEKKTVKKTYPFTWDFTNNKTTADAFTGGDEWAKISDGTFALNAKSWNYFQGNDLQKAENGSDILETQDLGIDVPHDKVNSLTVELGKGLKFGANANQVLTIPQVPAGYNAYILATVDNDGSIANNNTELSGETYKADKSKTIFVIDGNGNDINLTVKNALIEKIGITGTFKKFNPYNGKSYATEYRNHNEKYDFTGIFTNGKKVEANFIQEVDNNAHLAKTSSISIAPKETGVILTCSATDGVNAIPLFVKDVNSEESKIESNMLKGTLEETNQLEPNGVNYVFTRVSYNLDKDGKIVDSNNGKESTLGFYRVAANDDSNLAANKAYLHIPGSSPAKFYVIEGLFDTNTTTAISNVSTADHSAGEEGSYYTLTGIRLNGRPTHAGIYVLNGKKVIIK